LSRVGEIPRPPIEASEKIVRPPENPAPVALDAQPHSEDGSSGKLASRIAVMSGLEKREVIRRAQRKRRALGPVSLDVALLLLAREQNLEMGQLVEIP